MNDDNKNNDDIKKENIDHDKEKIENSNERKLTEETNTIDLNTITNIKEDDSIGQKIINLRKAQKMNLLIKNKLNVISLNKKNKEENNILFTSGWNHSSNNRLTKTLNNENILYKKNFTKCTPIRDSILKEYKKIKNGIILPDINTPKMIRDINFNSNNSETRENYTNTNSISTTTSKYRQKLNEAKLNSLKLNQENKFLSFETGKYKSVNLCTNINDITPSTRPVTNSNTKHNKSENVNEDFSKFQPGILSGCFNGNSNVIIPIFTVRRAESKRNCGLRTNILENLENKNGKYSQSLKNANNLFDQNNNYCTKSRNRQQIAKSQEIKINKDRYNILNNITLIPTFHKIKIEKGIKTTNFVNILNKKMEDYQKNIQQFHIKNKIALDNNII